MQTKKRAKPVKFGKAALKESAKEQKEAPVEISKEAAEADINSEEAKEIKQLIEEKTHPTESNPSASSGQGSVEETVEEINDDELPEQEESNEDEPEEVKLSEIPPEKQEEDMPLENTEPVTEVEPKELQEKESTSPYGSFTDEPPRTKQKNGYLKFFLLIACITFVVGLVIIGGISYFSSSMSSSSTMVISNTTPSPAAEPTASPTPEKPDLSAYSVKVLNGSGTTGEAAKVKSLLEDKGFSVASVGNATTSDYTKTEISAKKGVNEAYINELIKALQSTYSVNSVVDTSSSQATDVVVIVGSDTSK